MIDKEHIDVIGTALSIAGFIAVIIQLVKVDHSLKCTARGNIYDMASRIKEVFLNKPHLRPYFFDGEEISSAHPHYNEALSVADYYCLYLEQITTQKDNIDDSERRSWLKYAHDIYHGSPIIQMYLKDKEDWYSHKFWDVINGNF